MKQNNQTSWAARLRKLSALCLALVATSSAWAEDKVTAIVKPGETQQIAIALNNDALKPYTAFQMDIVLPDGLEFATGDDAVTLYRGKTSHNVEKNINGSTMKVVAYSYDGTHGNEPFEGDSGNLLIVKVKSTKEFASQDYTVAIQNQVFVDQINLSGDNSISKSAIKPYKMGDANGNDEITAADASLIQQNAARKIADDAEGFVISVADLNGDGEVTAADASLVQQFAAKKITSFNKK